MSKCAAHIHTRTQQSTYTTIDNKPLTMQVAHNVFIRYVHTLLRSVDVDPNRIVVKRAQVYTFHARRAGTFRHGGILLAGDSAHCMPPFRVQFIQFFSSVYVHFLQIAIMHSTVIVLSTTLFSFLYSSLRCRDKGSMQGSVTF
jgi:hypothetical protein